MTENPHSIQNPNCLSIPQSEHGSGSNALSYTVLVDELDRQELRERNAQKEPIQGCLLPLPYQISNRDGNKSEFFDISSHFDPILSKTHNFSAKRYLNLDGLFPTLYDRKESDEFLEGQHSSELLQIRRKNLDKNDQNLDYLVIEHKVQKKLGDNIIKSVVRTDEIVQLQNINQQSEIINQSQSIDEVQHFQEVKIDEYINIFKRNEEHKEELGGNDHYQIKIIASKQEMHKPIQTIKSSIVSINGQMKGNKVQLINTQQKTHLGMINSIKPLSNQKDSDPKIFSFGSYKSNPKVLDHNMIESKIISSKYSKKQSPIQAILPESNLNRNILDTKKPLVEVACRMKSTYDPKGPFSEFKTISNEENFSEPNKHELKNVPKQDQKVIEPLDPSLTQHQKHKNEIQQMISRLNHLEMIVGDIKPGSSSSNDKVVSHITLQKKTSKQKKLTRKNYKIQTLKQMAPDQLFNGLSSIDSNNQTNQQSKDYEKKSNNQEFYKKFEFLAQRILKLEEVILKKSMKQCYCKGYIDDCQPCDDRMIKINYKSINSSPKLLSRAKSQQRLNYIKHEQDQSISDEDILSLEDSIPTIDFPREQQVEPNRLAELGIQIIQKFSIKTQKKGEIDMLQYHDCVQYYHQSAHLCIRWEYSGLLYIGGGIHSQNRKFVKQGKGIEIVTNKYVFKGEFHKNKKQGRGVICNKFGQKYKGEWNNDLYEGRGKLYTTNSKYRGSFYQGKKHGRGVQKFKNGNIYEGEYYENNYHGNGTYRWNNGSTYSGEFKNDQMTGEGLWKSYRGDTYEGCFYKGKRHGYGRYTTKRGDVFQGQFANGDMVKKRRKGILSPQKQISFDMFDEGSFREMHDWDFGSKAKSPNAKKFVVQKISSKLSPTKSFKFSRKE